MKRHRTTDTLPDWNPGPNRPVTTPKARWYGPRPRNQKQKVFDTAAKKQKDLTHEPHH